MTEVIGISNVAECTHDRIDYQKCECLICGMMFQPTQISGIGVENDYETSRFTQRGKREKSKLFPPSYSLPYDNEVRNTANAISESLYITSNRIYKLKMRMYACLYFALDRLNRRFIPEELAGVVGIDPKDCSKALTCFSSICSGYQPPRKIVEEGDEHSSIKLAKSQAESLGLSPEAAEDIKEMIERGLKYQGIRLSRRKAKTISAGAIFAFYEINGITPDKDKVDEIIGVTMPTINQTKDEIMEAYNT